MMRQLGLPRRAAHYIEVDWSKSKMKKYFTKFLWTPGFWALIGLFGCGTGLYFQRLAGNGMGLWFLGLVFLGAAYIERTQ